METDILSVFLEYGSLGLFAAFLVWQHTSMQKRFDKLVERFQDQIETIRSDHKKDVEELRARYDAVISTYNEERTQIRSNLASKIKELKEDNCDLEKMLEKNEMKIDGVMINIESCLTTLRDMAQEQKMKALAKAAAQNKTLS